MVCSPRGARPRSSDIEPVSTCCTTNPCGSAAVADPANETLASALTNFTNEFFGTVTKTLVNGSVVWSLPCNLSDGLEGNPRVTGEGLACYFLRLIQEGTVVLSDGVLQLPEVADSPDPVADRGQIFVKAGALYYLSPGGIETLIAPA